LFFQVIAVMENGFGQVMCHFLGLKVFFGKSKLTQDWDELWDKTNCEWINWSYFHKS